jgi:hypothetical protein
MRTEDTATQMLRAVQGDFHPARHANRLRILRYVLFHHPNAQLVRCRDEHTGSRFGRAQCRRGRAVKIGNTSYSHSLRGTPYQLWAVWEDDERNSRDL